MQTQTIDLHTPADEAPRILLPGKDNVFAARAERFAALAAGHSLEAWLAFLARLAQAQHEALRNLPDIPLPGATGQTTGHGLPPLNSSTLPRPAIWHEIAKELAGELEALVPESARPPLAALRAAPDEQREAMAADLLAGTPDARDGAALPLIAAALQVVWTRQASQLDAAQLHRLDPPDACPCCGSPPVASIIRLADGVNKLRYLHCSLCNTQWNLPRAMCTACGTDKEVALQGIEGSDGAVRAETCDACHSYLKIVDQSQERYVDPVADDLATLALDMLVGEAGYSRSGPNLLLFGASGA